MNSNKKQWYKLTSDQVIKSLKSDIFGLSKQEAKSRLKQDGPNILPEGARISPFTIFKNQFKDVLIGVLIAAATVSMVLSLIQEKRASTEAFLIYIIVVAIAIVGFLNEYRAEKTLASLRNLLSFTAKVRRSGKIIEIDSSELVVGDIILIEEGQKIPADIRLIKGEQLSINESSLTGESTVSDKSTEIIPHNSALGDQKNMIFSGTYVASGTGEGVVIAIGSDTQIGKIATMVEGIEAELTPMQRKLNDLGKKLGIVVSVLCVVVFVAVLFFDETLSGSLSSRLIFAFTAAVALAV
ncbi:MAG: hypothetical protein QG659_302, partial [Patescibacteria group bacterium]|nr:hypothetical protein [Patescibacteria group bacterium]